MMTFFSNINDTIIKTMYKKNMTTAIPMFNFQLNDAIVIITNINIAAGREKEKKYKIGLVREGEETRNRTRSSGPELNPQSFLR